jgi:hypothetical protein
MIDIADTILKIILAILVLLGGKELISKVIFRFSKKEHNSYIASSSGETVGRDKVVINHFNFPSVGNPENLLSESAVTLEKNIAGEKIDLVSNSLKFLVITDNTFALTADEIDKITKFFQNVFDKNSNGRTSQSLMKGAFFALLSEAENTEWEEHCASSLREFFHEWKGSEGAISSAFNKIKKTDDTNFPTTGNNRPLYERMHLYYEYFSAKCHHEHDNAMRVLRSLYSNQELKHDTPDLFKKTVILFLTEMDSFLKLIKI